MCLLLFCMQICKFFREIFAKFQESIDRRANYIKETISREDIFFEEKEGIHDGNQKEILVSDRRCRRPAGTGFGARLFHGIACARREHPG